MDFLAEIDMSSDGGQRNVLLADPADFIFQARNFLLFLTDKMDNSHLELFLILIFLAILRFTFTVDPPEHCKTKPYDSLLNGSHDIAKFHR